ncbi:tyrosine-type recombinase/integrase [Paenibacillus macquariensis]|uniref:Site-specific recombinase XerC n=1 Tax=Paenibacillus macquariensis TaxID=948756 RepID=A0ABY1KE70_9BACL|nr:site-specific integrase [Paenibacillus macquariensis]MEC0093424.1 site-specific integrase [Paenibacillus macquariensis]SIR69880.1 Site-specific recombinase XerC [Paenibacillus macquariensis]
MITNLKETQSLNLNKKHYKEFHQEVTSYLEHLIKQNKSVYVASTIRIFLSHISKNHFNNIPINKIESNDILPIYIEQYRELLYKKTKKSTVNLLMGRIRNWLKFLKKNELANATYYNAEKNQNIRNLKYPNVIFEFERYIETFKNYTQPETYRKHVQLFYSYLRDTFSEDLIGPDSYIKISQIGLRHINDFEDSLSRKVASKKIKRGYMYTILKSIRLFFNYLKKRKLSDIKYYPPKRLQTNANRSNEYVEVHEVKEMIKHTFNPKPGMEHFSYRNLAILLLIFSTGCRPIEISNLKISDLWITESSVSLVSKKSKMRKLKIPREVMGYIEKYLDYRDCFHPSDDSLFQKKSGLCITSRNIYTIFRKSNFAAFKKMIGSPKSFRHTYITNALEAVNDIKKVAESVGHKNLSSTESYRYKTDDRLVANTLDIDPIMKYTEDIHYEFD